MTAVNELPSEVLLIIFQLLYDGSRSPRSDVSEVKAATYGEEYSEYDRRNSSLWRWNDEHVTPPTLFPYAVSNVCTRWRDITTAVPAFWTRVVFCIDSLSDLTPSLVRHCFERSQAQPIQVCVTRMRKSPDENVARDAAEERAKVRMIVEHLLPHLERCESICFNLVYRSSILSACGMLGGEAPNLRALTLNSRVTDTTEEVRGLETLDCPQLTHLEVDAHTLLQTHRALCSWALLNDMDRAPFSLAVSHCKAARNEDNILISRLLAFLGDCYGIRVLSIKDISLQQTGYTLDDGPIFLPDLRELHLEGLEGDALSELFENIQMQPEKVTISRCEFLGRWPEPIRSSSLTLANIDDASEILCFFENSRWYGTSLTFQRCLGCSDELILELMTSNRPYFPRELHISECPPVHPETLKRIVNTRRQHQHPDALTALTVVSPGVPAPQGLEDWMAERNPLVFRWDSAPSIVSFGTGHREIDEADYRNYIGRDPLPLNQDEESDGE
ncbi:hypothetical protein CONPUDRAFT_143451 [Coniophora puteana RWD-64-598 SS2]|uniref:Uncharacterized protein n=1 Tax=Coniophora puteana (strain RWD-64-598) TaxID=741705 RepID=A0A5M3MRN7_CONPW|nr:uncharacterized protein CONPUDRAFT_143451 [Coniophora puteana RWD-64-598 SS2]EIW81746.1 hypothetical protein CONPUDRAFT_143451 [Coniophora puteana RWD-64-598 SS2]